MRIATWNLLHGQPIPPTSENPFSSFSESQSNQHLSEIAQFISSSGIEIIGLQEIDDSQERSGLHSQIAKIAQHMNQLDSGRAQSGQINSGKRNSYHFAYARTVIGTPGFKWRKLRKDEEVINPNDGQASYGIGLISQIPVKQWQTLSLGRSWVGLPLAVPGGKNGKSIRFLYVRDEPRIALAAQLENGYTVAVTHLSFVPLVNLWQLFRVKRWLKEIRKESDHVILLGDLNLPFNIPMRPRALSEWRSLHNQKSYPSWKPSVKFDYILSLKNRKKEQGGATEVELPPSGYSDHLPLAVDLV